MWGTNATTQQRGLFPESYVAVEVVAHKPNAVPPPIPKRDKVDRSSTSSAMSKRSSAGGGDRSSTSSVTTAVDPKGEADAAAQEEEEEDEVAPLASGVSKVGFSESASSASPPAIPKRAKAKVRMFLQGVNCKICAPTPPPPLAEGNPGVQETSTSDCAHEEE
jgi:hypothetical protein